jgi:far upstream element-binding protein
LVVKCHTRCVNIWAFEVANGEIRRDVPTNSNEGRIIGRQGTKIRELQDRFRTKITMNRAMHLAEVVGKLADVNACCDEIMQIVAEGNVREAVDRAGQPMQAVGGARGGDRVGGDRGGFSGYMERVPCEGQEGRIIGRGGENIRRVESQTGTRIKMNRVECVAEVYGSPQQCAEAVRMIQEYIHTAPSRQGGGGGGYGQQQGGGYQQQGGYGQQQGGYGQQQHGGYQQGGYGGGYQQGGYQQGGYGGGYQQQAAAYGQQAQQRGGFPGASGAPLPHGWEEVNPGNGGPVYYWNTVTNATQYERPN